MTVAVVPAAGRSRRMGRPKLLLPFGDTTVVGAVVRALTAGGAAEIVLVTAPGDGELARWARKQGLTRAENPHPERGMLSTIQAGLAALGGGAALARRGEVLLVTPADLPALTPATVRALLDRRAEAGALLAVPTYRGRRGHPLAISPRLIPEIDRLDREVGLRQLLDRHPGDLLEVAVDDPGAVRDVDTPRAYRALLDRAALK